MRKLLAIAPALIGVSAILAYVLPFLGGENSFLTKWGGSSEVTMKPVTALCFVFSGVVLLASESEEKRSLLSLGIFLNAVILSAFINLGKETGEALTVGFNVPSIGTLGVFLSFGSACLWPRSFRFFGKIIIGICSLAIVGHLVNHPPFYFYFEGWSTALARPTAIAGMLVGMFMVRDAE